MAAVLFLRAAADIPVLYRHIYRKGACAIISNDFYAFCAPVLLRGIHSTSIYSSLSPRGHQRTSNYFYLEKGVRQIKFMAELRENAIIGKFSPKLINFQI